ncbi:GH116 family glycosyl hydrolase [Caldivirga sp.]|uniref:GH116 family glycosyl hydrolase n=1 Tax=Caldivirga sp. TaxID=2080243 RepID=UPI0025B84F79|nr:GH116 family glycosyl hydrolase [Caldivirga sp.]
MVKYTCGDALMAGVPLGGIGAGGVELDNNGMLINARFANNWNRPIRVLEGFHIIIKPRGLEPIIMHCSASSLPTLSKYTVNLSLEGRWPFAWLRASRNGVDVEVEAFTPIIPGNLKDSTLPALAITVKVRGSGDGLVAVSMPNVVGSTTIGRVNEAVHGGVRFRNLKANQYDPFNGELTLITDNPRYVITQYNLINIRDTIRLNKFIENEEPWQAIISSKEYGGDVGEAMGEAYRPAGLVASEYGKDSEVRFVVSWFFNNPWLHYPYRHYYANHFSSSLEVAEYFLSSFDRLRSSTLDWQSRLIDPSLPDWLKDAIINSAYILSSSTWLDERGRFTLFEAPENGPMLGTIAGACYETGSLPVVLMFPELEKSFLKQLTNAIRDDGYVPHDLGPYYSLDMPSDGTTAPPRWKDTNPTYILLVYRYFVRTGDVEFLRETYPKLLKVLEWELSQDKDGDGVPECEGTGDTGFDVTPITSLSSYIASLQVASLMAMVKIAEVLGDSATVSRISGILERARRVLNGLFNGKVFIPWTGEPKAANASFLAQIWGEWWSMLLDLGHVADEDKVKRALESMLSINASVSECHTPNMAGEHGEWEKYSQLTASWPRLVFAVSSLGYALGYGKWLEAAKKEWDTLVKLGLTWNQPSRIEASCKPEQGYLDHYIGSASPWSFTYKYALSKVSM